MQLKTFILAVLKWVASLTELSRIPPGVAIQIQAVGFLAFFCSQNCGRHFRRICEKREILMFSDLKNIFAYICDITRNICLSYPREPPQTPCLHHASPAPARSRTSGRSSPSARNSAAATGGHVDYLWKERENSGGLR